MSPVYTGAATKYRVCGLCGRQARVVQPEADAGCFRQKSVVKSFRRKSPYSPSWPVFPRALSPRQGWGTGRRPLRDNLAAAAAYGAALRRNSCLEPQRKSRRRNRFSRPPPSGGTADEAGARPLRKALRTFLPAGGNHPAEHVAAQMDAFVQLQRKGLGGRGLPRRHHARDQINLPFRKSTSREKRPPRRYSVFCISTASSAGVA